MKYAHYEISNPLFIKWFFDGKDSLSIGVNFDLICNICQNNYIICEHTAGYKYGKKICKPKKENLTIEHTAHVENPRMKGCGVKKIFIPIGKLKTEYIRKYGRKKVNRPDYEGETITQGIIAKTGEW